ncbi:DUF6082 family protein [Streptomyces xanthochromogenes]|uniref:Uncharacterized protein n=1 Tax=Streptomyces xanthochromogenes TaxID=67384 RepID=A0ABQ2ZDK3_9ACTN|nr:DUF6082 family protein [Streptomyces xanthochromogenes]GGY13497.1 hypothetical protein GCM10010326_00980 [Streptomyces xanthochromogenes]
MKAADSVLVLAAVAAAGIALSQRQHRQQLDLQAVALHQAWITDAASSPDLANLWAAGSGQATPEYTNLLRANRVMALLCAKFRVGLLNQHALRVQARWLMERPIGRQYWKMHGAFREEEATDGRTRAFNRIMSDEYIAVSDRTTAAA